MKVYPVSPMERENQTVATEFIFLKFTSLPQFQVLLFVLFRIIYIFSLMGNLFTILIVLMDSGLHTAMSFFICNLPQVKVWYITVTVPKMLANFLADKRTISFLLLLLLLCWH
ncbi:unnamed protein product [Caretta caretta]